MRLPEDKNLPQLKLIRKLLIKESIPSKLEEVRSTPLLSIETTRWLHSQLVWIKRLPPIKLDLRSGEPR